MTALPEKIGVVTPRSLPSRIMRGCLFTALGGFALFMGIGLLAQSLGYPKEKPPAEAAQGVAVQPATPAPSPTPPHKQVAAPVVHPPPTPPPPALPVPDYDLATRTCDFGMALTVTSRRMEETTNEFSPGALTLALWSAKCVLSVATIKERLARIDYGEAMKDPDAAAGSRYMCSAGKIIEISVDRSGGPPVYAGGLMTTRAQVVRFFAVGDTTGIVEDSRAQLCGVFAGTMRYANALGGTTHAPVLVGGFVR